MASWKLFRAPLRSESTRYRVASSAATAGGSGAFVRVDLSCPTRIIASVGLGASLVFVLLLSPLLPVLCSSFPRRGCCRRRLWWHFPDFGDFDEVLLLVAIARDGLLPLAPAFNRRLLLSVHSA